MKSEQDSTAVGLKRTRALAILSHEAAPLLLGGAVEDDADFFEGDEAAVDHFVETGKNLFDALGGFDDFENDGQILRESQQLVRMIDARAAVAAGDEQEHQDANRGEKLLFGNPSPSPLFFISVHFKRT